MTARNKWWVLARRALFPSARSLRMSLYSTLVFGGVAAAASRSVYADVREMGLAVGHQLAKLEDLTGGASIVRINGAELHRASALTAQSTHEVLDRYESYCRDNPGALATAMRDIPTAMVDRAFLPKVDPIRASVVRDESGDRGMVVCFASDPATGGEPARSLAERLQALAETGDLSKLGHFRYVFAEKNASGRPGSHVVTFWSDGELNLDKMFPARGDAPGTDSSLVPRPVGARRTLSASVDGSPAAVRIFDSPGKRAVSERAFDESLKAKGFVNVALPASPASVAYLRADSAQVFLSFVESESRTTVTMVEATAAPNEGVRVDETL